jgi:hypothetical protein
MANFSSRLRTTLQISLAPREDMDLWEIVWLDNVYVIRRYRPHHL